MSTNFPTRGEDKPVSLASSRWERFPLGEAEELRDKWPEIWAKGGNVLGNTQFRRLAPMARDNRAPKTPTEEKAVRLREAWIARHYKDYRLPGIVAQIKWLAVGSRGLEYMRRVIAEAKDKMEKSQFVAPLEALEGKRARFIITSGDIDRQGEIVDPNGWDFVEYMRNPVILDSHRYGSIADIVGRAVSEPRREGDRWTVDIEFADTPMGELAERLVAQGMLKAVSVGFRSLQRRPEKGITRHVKQELLEVSLVAVPANPAALRIRAAVGYQDLELAGEELAWDSDAAVSRLRQWASGDGSGEPGAIDWSKYRRAFMVAPAGEEEATLGGYRLPYADIIGGKLRAIPRAIFAIAALLAGARGGVKLEPEERAAVLEQVGKYYEKLDRELPAGLREELVRSYGMEEDLDQMKPEDEPKGVKNEALMELRDHLVQAVAILETMLEDYGEQDDQEDKMPENGEGEMEESAKEAEMVEVARALLARLGG